MGFVAIHDSFFDGWIWKLPPDQLKVILYCIRRARWKRGEPDRWWNGEAFMDVPRGAFLSSVRKISDACGVSKRQAETALKIAEKDGMISRQFSGRKLSLVTLTKYATYQDPKPEGGTQSGTQAGHKRDVEEPSTLSLHADSNTSRRKKEKHGHAVSEAAVFSELDSDVKWVRENIAGLDNGIPDKKLRPWVLAQQRLLREKHLDWRITFLGAAAHPARLKRKDMLAYYSNWVRRELPAGIEEDFTPEAHTPSVRWNRKVDGVGYYLGDKLVADVTGRALNDE